MKYRNPLANIKIEKECKYCGKPVEANKTQEAADLYHFPCAYKAATKARKRREEQNERANRRLGKPRNPG